MPSRSFNTPTPCPSLRIGPAPAQVERPVPGTLRRIAFAAFASSAFGVAAQTPLKADVRQGRLCKAVGPPDWSFTSENPAGTAFGADIQRADGQAIASY